MTRQELDNYYQNLDKKFIETDPISIPHRYTTIQDIEISGFFAAMFAWGRRDIILSKTSELMRLMEGAPFEFILNYHEAERKKIQYFRHRTFNPEDLDFYLSALKKYYQIENSLENLFFSSENEPHIEKSLYRFYSYFEKQLPKPNRSLKHISTPLSGSACKRLCMYLRWMVRKDEIDFGLWKSIQNRQLIIPLDVHVMHVAIQLGLLDETDKPNWKTALKLTSRLSEYDQLDPVKYDLVLFSMGIHKFEGSM